MRVRAYLANIESELPIRISLRGGNAPLTLASAKALLLDLSAAVKAVDAHFQCSGSLLGQRCLHRGSVKIGDHYYCKVHARKMAKSAKVLP